MKPLRIGVVGVGHLGKFHAQKFAAMDGVALVGVVDPDRDRVQSCAESLQTTGCLEPAELLGKVDAVSIVVPTVLHHSVAKPFLEAGVHVFLEKPITETVAQADELIEVAARNAVVFQIGHIERFNPAITALRTLVKRPYYMTAERAAPFTARCTDVSVVLDLMIHDLDLVLSLAGSEPQMVSSAGASIITDKIDVATARVRFANGCIADLSASRISADKKRLLRCFEGGAIYEADFQNQQASVFSRGGQATPELEKRVISTERTDQLNDELTAFVRSINTRAVATVTGAEGRKALALARTIEDAILKHSDAFMPVAS